MSAPAPSPPGGVLVREAVTPRWAPFALPRPGLDGLLRRRGDGLVRLLHHGDAPVAVAVAVRGGEVAFAARGPDVAAARAAIARVRFAVGVDDDLAPFHARFREDAVIGRAVRAFPALRAMRRPVAWEALAWAVTEQLIDLDRAVEVQRRLVRALGRRCPRTGLRDAPAPDVVADATPARLAATGLAPKRAIALRRVAAEVAASRVDLARSDLRRLLAIRGIGTWTVECTALFGQGRLDVVPAGDLGFKKLVGRLRSGRPGTYAEESEVREFFGRYDGWSGLASEYLRYAAATGLLTGSTRSPRRGGTRSSAAPRRAVA